MTASELKIIITTLLFVLSISFGIWLSRLGRPLNSVVFTFHKIISVSLIVFIVLTIYGLRGKTELRIQESTSVIITGLFVLVTFVSGALLSFEKLHSRTLRISHKVCSFVSAVSTFVSIYLLAVIE